MKKVFIIHGFDSKPNGGWRSWLLGKLSEQDIYACALSMPTPDKPSEKDWVSEISRVVLRNLNDEIILVGHSLGVVAVLRFLEKTNLKKKISKAILISGPIEKTKNKYINDFFKKSFNFKKIKTKVNNFIIIHGDNDEVVPFSAAETLSKELDGKLIKVNKGGHLNGSSGWVELPQALEAIIK